MRCAKRTDQDQRAKAKTLCKAGCSLNLNTKAIATVQSGQAKSKELLMEATFI
jgi:hypothetical protein